MNYRQAGITLIELLIGLVLSSLLVAGICSLFVQSQKVSSAQRAINAMMEDGRFVLDVFQKEIRRAGGLRNKLDANGSETFVLFKENEAIKEPTNVELPVSVVDLFFDSGEFIRGSTGSSSPTNDSIVIRYQLNDMDDLGISSHSNSLSACTVSSFLDPTEDPAIDTHVVNVYFYIENGNLQCTSQRSVKAASSSTSDFNCVKNCNLLETPVTLINNVESFTINYGIDSDNPRDRVSNYYVAATLLNSSDPNIIAQNVTPLQNPLAWQNVTSVQIVLILKSYGYNSTQLNRTFYSTIALRNQI